MVQFYNKNMPAWLIFIYFLPFFGLFFGLFFVFIFS